MWPERHQVLVIGAPLWENILTVDDDVVLQLAIGGGIQMMASVQRGPSRWEPTCWSEHGFRADSSGVTGLYLFSSSFSSPLFLPLCLEKAAVTKITAPPPPFPAPQRKMLPINWTWPHTYFGILQGCLCVSVCPQLWRGHVLCVLEHEKILCGRQRLCTKRTLIKWCIHFPAWIRDNLGWLWSITTNLGINHMDVGALTGFGFWFQF